MSDWRSVLELTYFICAGPLLMIIVAFGLWQLKITKDTARMNAKREAYQLAADQCSYYMSHIIPVQNKLADAIEKNGVKFFEKAVTRIEGGAIRVNFNSNKDDIAKLRTVASELLDVCNSMEAFSLFFISGVADEGVAYSSLGTTFCSEVHELSAYVAFCADSGHYQNLLRLYLLWNARMESRKLLDNKQEIEDKLKSIENKAIKPLGTD